MANINSYPLDTVINDSDKLIGSDGANAGVTKNYTVASLKQHILESVDSGTTLSKTVTITPAQILALDTQLFVEILPAPEEGMAYFIDKAYFHLDFNTTPYDITSSASFYYYDPEIGVDSLGNLTVGSIASGAINNSENITVLYASYGNSILLNSPVYLRFVGTVSQGDSNMKVKVDYKLIDIAL